MGNRGCTLQQRHDGPQPTLILGGSGGSSVAFGTGALIAFRHVLTALDQVGRHPEHDPGAGSQHPAGLEPLDPVVDFLDLPLDREQVLLGLAEIASGHGDGRQARGVTFGGNRLRCGGHDQAPRHVHSITRSQRLRMSSRTVAITSVHPAVRSKSLSSSSGQFERLVTINSLATSCPSVS